MLLTTQLSWQTNEDIIIQPTEKNGLKKTSLVRLNKFATLDKDLIVGRIGSLDKQEMKLLNENLIRVLKLENQD